MDRKWQAVILNYMEDEIAPLADPRSRGKGLIGDNKVIWRYRVGDYRIPCQILDTSIVIVVLNIGHRKDVYDRS